MTALKDVYNRALAEVTAGRGKKHTGKDGSRSVACVFITAIIYAILEINFFLVSRLHLAICSSSAVKL